MLGAKIGEDVGKVTGARMLPTPGGRYLKNEISFQAEGTLLGEPATDMGTYTVEERIPGQLYGEGQGILMTKDGAGIIWNGFGVGTLTGKGMGMKFAAAISFQTNVPKYARLNSVVGVIEHEIDEHMVAKSRMWEWKSA